MDVSSDISLPSVKVKHRFYQWATKWFHGSVEQSTDPPDVANLVCLLQSLGCHLREFNKNDATDDGIKQDSIRIIMECGSSRMRAVMELDEVVCRCQTKDDVKDASFWSVSGTARGGSVDSVNKFEETGSNLLPQVSKDHRALIHDVLYRLLATINSGDINQNRSSLLDVSFNQTAGSQLSPSDKSDSIARSNTQPEIFRSKNVEHTFAAPSPIGPAERRMSISAQNILKLPIITKTIPTPELTRRPILHRQKTWDLEGKGDSEPRPSPPKISSSPVVLNELCSSLDQVSLHSDGDNSNIGLAECLMKIQMYANRALNLCGSPSKDEGLLRPSQQKLSPGSQPGSACSSPATMTSKDAAQITKPLARKSIGTTQPTKQLTVLRGTPSKLPPKRKSPTLRLMAAGGQKTPVRRTPGLKKDSTFPTSTSNSSLSSSSDSRAVVCARRRVSPDPRSPAVRPGNLSLRTTTISKSGISSSSSQKAASTPKSSISSGDSLSSDANQKKSVSPNPQVKKTGGTTPASRLNVLKKEK